jgi:hypothetical protein
VKNSVWLLAVVLFLAAGWWRLHGFQGGKTRPDSETLLVYPLLEPLRFSVQPEQEAMKLVTWAAAADGWSADRRAVIPYALRVRVLNSAEIAVVDQVEWLSTHSCWEESTEGGRPPCAWLPGGEAISENRSVMVALDALGGAAGTLEVQTVAAPPGARVLMAAFARGERDETKALRLEAGRAPAAAAALAQGIGALDWATVPAAWKAELARAQWQRVSANANAGGDAHWERILTTWAHNPWEEIPARGISLIGGGAAAWNVRGPARWEAEWTNAAGDPAVPTRGSLRIVRDDGTVTKEILAGSGHIGPIDIPAGVASVQVALEADESPRMLTARVSGDSWGSPAWLATSTAGERQVGVELRSTELFRTRIGEPLPFEVTDREDITLTARLRLPAGPLPGFPTPPVEASAELRVTALGTDDTSLGSWTVSVDGAASPFERYTRPDAFDTARTSEPRSWVVTAPEGTSRLLVDSDAEVDVGLRVNTPLAARVTDARYELAEAQGPERREWVARYVPDLNGVSVARAPTNVEELAHAGRVVRIDEQVRLEPREETSGQADAVSEWHALPIAGAFELLAQAQATPTVQPVGGRLKLDATPRHVAIAASGRLVMEYRVPESAVGTEVVGRVGSQPFRQLLSSAGGTITLRKLEPGVSSVEVDSRGLFLAPSGTAPAPWIVRRVHRIGAGAVPLRWPGGAGALSLQVCGEIAGAVLRWESHLADPPPGLAAARAASAGARELQALGGVAMPLSFAGSPLECARPEFVRVSTSPEQAPGTVTVAVTGRPGVRWLRASSTVQTADARHPDILSRTAPLP